MHFQECKDGGLVKDVHRRSSELFYETECEELEEVEIAKLCQIKPSCPSRKNGTLDSKLQDRNVFLFPFKNGTLNPGHKRTCSLCTDGFHCLFLINTHHGSFLVFLLLIYITLLFTLFYSNYDKQ